MTNNNKQILITGVTLTGNLGGVAMAEAIRDLAQQHQLQPALASILPGADKQSALAKHYRIVDFSYKPFLLFYAPYFLLLLLLPLPKRLKRRLACLLAIGRAFAQTRAVIDLSGIAFVDGRGIALLWYNAAIVLPALVCGTPIFKMSQALGPFSGFNQWLARFILSRVNWVYSRGHISQQHTQQLGLTNSSYAPDVSFALNTGEQHQQAVALLPANNRNVVICPSKVVYDYCLQAGIELLPVLSHYIAWLEQQGFTACLLPHSEDSGIGKNNDLALCQQLLQQHKASHGESDIQFYDPNGDPRLAREIIGQAEFAITCRFHSLIAALATATPAITIGWNHKYQEAAAPFAIDNLVIDHEQLCVDTLIEKTQCLLEQAKTLQANMAEAANKARSQSTLAINETLEKVV